MFNTRKFNHLPNTRQYLTGRFASLKHFLHDYEPMIFDHLSYEQMIALTMTSEELFECRASVHLKKQTNATIIDNCFRRFRISRHIYANNDFGICYKFFDQDYEIRLEYNDMIEVTIKDESMMNFMFNSVFDRYDKLELKAEEYFRLYYFANTDTQLLPTRDTATSSEQIKYIRLSAFIKSLSFESLSTPYMPFCQRSGKT